jgi:hypothetical protein
MRVSLRTIVILVVLCLAAAVGAADYEAPRDRSGKQLLPASMLKGKFYRVRDVVPTDGTRTAGRSTRTSGRSRLTATVRFGSSSTRSTPSRSSRG